MFFPCIEMSFEIESQPAEKMFLFNLAKNFSWFNEEIDCEDTPSDVSQISFMMRLG